MAGWKASPENHETPLWFSRRSLSSPGLLHQKCDLLNARVLIYAYHLFGSFLPSPGRQFLSRVLLKYSHFGAANFLDKTLTCMVHREPRSTSCPHGVRCLTQSDHSIRAHPSIFIFPIFINLQIPLPATPVFSDLYKTPGVYMPLGPLFFAEAPLALPDKSFKIRSYEKFTHKPFRFRSYEKQRGYRWQFASSHLFEFRVSPPADV